MPVTGNAINNKVLAGLASQAGARVTAAIHKASLKTGVDFAYLMEKAATESSFDTDAQAKGSSARGLYQFIDSTWLKMVNRYGEKYGLGQYAAKINDSGKVADTATRHKILALRDNPELSADMAGELAAENKAALIANGIKAKDIGPTELYLAHFLGSGSASEFIKAEKQNPLAAAADIFPRAAKANKNVFYDQKTQRARSLGEITSYFDKKFGASSGGTLGGSDSMVASTAGKAEARYHSRPRFVSDDGNAAAAQISPELAMMSDPSTGSDEANAIFGRRAAAVLQATASTYRQAALTSTTRTLMSNPVSAMAGSHLTIPGDATNDEDGERDSRTNRRNTGNRTALAAYANFN